MPIKKTKVRSSYWAVADRDHIAEEIASKFDDYLHWFENSGNASAQRLSYARFYALDQKGALHLSKSRDGKIINMNVNHYRALIEQQHTLVTQAKIAFISRAVNSDVKSQRQTSLANGYLDYMTAEKGLDGVFSNAARQAMVLTEAYLEAAWDFTLGKEVDSDVNGASIRAGEQVFNLCTAFNVARDTGDNDKRSWYIVKRRVNKYDLAVRFPMFKDAIETSSVEKSIYMELNPIDRGSLAGNSYEDLTDLYVLYHDRTMSSPDGRETWVCGGEVLQDKKLRYKKLPVYRLSAGNVIESTASYGTSYDLLPVTEAITKLFTAVTTNNLNLAISSIYSSDPNLSVQNLADGMNLVVATAKPEVLNLAGSSGETYKLIDTLVQQTQLLSGINSVARGDPSASLKSGNALSIMFAAAIQAQIDMQKAYASFAGDVGSAIISNLQAFASEPILAAVGGKTKKSFVKEFTSEDVKDIDRVIVDLGNPVSQTVAGRLDMATLWLQQQLIKTPSEFIQVMESGNLDTVTDNALNHSLYIREVCEILMGGGVPVPLVTDDHDAMVMAIRGVLDDDDARRDPTIVQNCLSTIQQHISLRNSITPDLGAILGLQPLPSAQQAQQAPQPQGGPQSPASPEQPKVNGVDIPPLPPGSPPQAQASMDQLNTMIANNPSANIPQ
jgi:hypothetical protein